MKKQIENAFNSASRAMVGRRFRGEKWEPFVARFAEEFTRYFKHPTCKTCQHYVFDEVPVHECILHGYHRVYDEFYCKDHEEREEVRGEI